jgi:sulfite exporter TauE/SafE
MVVQVALGWMHHSYFVKHKRRSGWSHAHMNLGRVLMILGAINGGIGLTIARAPMAYRSSYAIVAAGFLTVYFLLAIATELKRRQAKRNERRASSGERAGSPGPYGYPMTPLGGAVVSKTRTNTGQSI